MPKVPSVVRTKLCMAALAAVVYGSVLPAAHAAEIPWKSDLLERTSVDEDIRNVLRSLLQQNGQEVVFRKGVAGTVSFTFTRTPLQGAFNKLIDENNLDYDYNADTKTVTISPRGTAKTVFLPLKYLDEATINGVKNKFRLAADVVFDARTKTVMLKGDPDQIDQLKDLIGRLEVTQNESIKEFQENSKKARDDEAKAAEAEKLRAESQRINEGTEASRRNRIERENIEVKVIALQYASVGEVTIQFQGQSVKLKGMKDTLKELLGLSVTKEAVAEAAKSQDRPVTVAGQYTESGPQSSPEPVRQVIRDQGVSFLGQISDDARTNSIIVRGVPREIKQVEDLLAKLDKPMEQIEIEAIICDTTRKDAEELGIKLGSEQAQLNSDNIGAVGGGIATLGLATSKIATSPLSGLPATTTIIGADQRLVTTGGGGVGISPLTLLPSANGANTFGAFVYRGAKLALTAQLNALESNKRAHVLASPRVVTIDNLAATITSDQSKYVTTPGGVGGTGGLSLIPLGLTLKITPSVLHRGEAGDDNMIRLVIDAQNTSGTINFGGGIDKAGTSVQTQVIIPDHSTFVLGGLTNDNRNENLDSVPVLSEIPILGELFKNRSSSHDLNETLFFITPRIVSRAELYNSDVAQKRYLQARRNDINRVGEDVRRDSALLKLNTSSMEEDE